MSVGFSGGPVCSSELFVKEECTEEPDRLNAIIMPDPYQVYSDGEDGIAGEDEDDEDDAVEEIPNLEGVQEEFKDRVEAVLKNCRKRYHPKKEIPPTLPAYHESFDTVQRYCEDLVSEAAEVMHSSDYHDSFVEQLLDEIQEKKKIKYPPAQQMGVIGDSGAGKSSLINALLDTPGLAARGADTSACTCVVTSFYQSPPDQKSSFMATVELYEPYEITVMLRDYLKEFYESNGQSPQDLDADELELRRKDGESAFTALFALFRNRQEFADEESAKDFLSTATCAKDEMMLDKFSAWIDEFLDKQCDADGTIKINVESTEDLAQSLERYVTNISNSVDDDNVLVASYWPIVRTVRVGLDAPLLRRGLELADLPGTSDTNKIRTKVTRDYIRNCTYYVVVAPILRVLTEESVHQKLMHGFTINRHQKILVLTKLDCDLSIAARPRLNGATPEVLDEIDRLFKAAKAVNAERTKRTKPSRSSNGDVWKENQQQISKLGIRQVLAEFKSKQTSLSVRKKYQAITSRARHIQVHSVSNADYEKRVEGILYEEDIPLPIELTGIPRLRKDMSSLPAIKRFTVLQRYVESHIPSLISNMETWGSQATLKKQGDLRVLVAKPQKMVNEEIDRLIHGLMSLVAKTILGPIGKRQEAWILHGTRGFQDWDKMHLASFGAWCRRSGVHKTKTVPYLDWNRYLLEPVVKDVEGLWDGLEEGIQDSREKCFQGLNKLRDSIRADLNSLDGISMVPMTPFLESLGPKRGDLRNALKVFSEEVVEISRNAKLDTILSEDEGYLMQAMNPLYERCNEIPNGKGANYRRKGIIGDAMTRGEPYSRILPSIQTAFEIGLQKERTKLLEQVKRIFDEILQNFDRMFVVEELPNERRDELRQRALIFAKKAKATIDGPIATHLATAAAAESE